MAKVTKKKKGGMSEFFDESVAENALSVMKSNKPFIVSEDGTDVYICARLDTSKVGGFNKKTKGDSANGGIINGVKGGQIDAYVTAETNDNEQLILIPTAKTLDAIQDYGKFTAVKYELVKLDSECNVTGTGIEIGYGSFLDIIKERKSVADFLSGEESVDEADADESSGKKTGVMSGVLNKAKDIVESTVEAVKNTVINSEPEEAPDDEFPDDFNTFSNEDFGGGSVPQESQQPSEQYDEQAEEYYDEPYEEVLITEEQVMDTVTRTFYADDLNLMVSTEPFDQLFIAGNRPIQFDLHQTEGFVDGEMNRRMIDYNRNLRKVHQDNILKMREQYLALVGNSCSNLQSQLDMTDPTTFFGEKKAAIDEQRNARLATMESVIAKRRADMDEVYNARMNEAAETAASAARASYKQRFQKQHDEEVYSLDAKVRSEIQSDYTQALHELYENRRSRALSMLDVHINGAMAEISENYRDLFAQESELYNQYAEELNAYADTLHAEDVRRLVIEEERIRQSNAANDVYAEMTAKLDSITAEFTAKQKALEAERDSAVRRADETVELVNKHADERIQLMQQEKEALQTQLDKATERYQKAEENVKRDYDHRLEQAHDSEKAWQDKFDNYVALQKHHSKLAVILTVAVIAASIAGGFIIGNLYYANVAKNTTYTEIEQKWAPEGYTAGGADSESSNDESSATEPAEETSASASEAVDAATTELSDLVDSSTDAVTSVVEQMTD